MITIYYDRLEDCPLNEQNEKEHLMGLTLLSHGLKDLYGIDLALKDLPEQIGFGQWGKPFLKDYPNIHFNISHSHLLGICGFDDTPIGVDLEKPKKFHAAILKKALSPEETAIMESLGDNEEARREYFARLWTLKESRVKLTGEGLTIPIVGFSFTIDMVNDPSPVTGSEKNFFYLQKRFQQDFFLSICASHPVSDIVFEKTQVATEVEQERERLKLLKKRSS